MIKLNHLIKQKYDFDCGPASLAMIFCYYNKCQDYPDLLKKASENHGTGNFRMKELAEEIGFRTEVKENASIDDIKKFLEKGIPVVVNYIEPSEGWGHYAVVTGINDKIILANPDTGKEEEMEIDGFKKRWVSGSGKHKQWMLAVIED